MKRKYLIIASLIAITVIALLWGSLFGEEKVEVVKLERGNLINVVYATGTVSADTIATLRCESAGIVKYLNAVEGETVSKGQLLLRTDQSDYLLNLRAAENDLKTAKVELSNEELNYNRKLKLKASTTISQNEFDDAKKNYKLAKLRVEQQNISVEKAKQNLSDTEIYSPFEGVIISSEVNIGDYLSPGNECFKVSAKVNSCKG